MKLSSKHLEYGFIGLVASLAAVVRGAFISRSAIWHDEAYTAAISQLSFSEIIARTMRDVHPPLYYFVMHLWQGMFGTSPAALRSLSLVCGVLLVIIGYLLVRRLFDVTTARLAAITLALAPFLVRFSDEARMYSLIALIITTATYALVKALDHTAERRLTTWWIVYGLLVAAALYTQYYAVLIAPVHIGYAWYRRGGLRQLVTCRPWWIAHGIAAALFAPWVPAAIAQVSRVQGNFWIPPLTYESIPGTFAQFMRYESSGDIVPKLICLTIMVLALLYLWYRRRQFRGSIALLTAWLVVPIAIIAIASLKRPVYLDRYFTYASVAFYLLLAVIVSLAPPRKWRAVISPLLVLVLGSYFITQAYPNIARQTNHRVDTVASYVTSHTKPGDAVIAAELLNYFDFSYYYKGPVAPLLFYSTPPSGYGELGMLYDKPIFVRELSSITNDRVWIVAKHDYTNRITLPATWQRIDRTESPDTIAELYRTR